MKRLLACLLALTAVSGGQALAKKYDFSFVGYYSGLRIAEADGSLDWGDGRYRLNIRAKSDGIVDWFMTIDHLTRSEGSIGGRPFAETHYYLSRDGKKKTEIELAFTPESVEIVAADPHPEEEKRSPVTAEMKRGALDPLTAVLALGMTASDETGCNASEQVFDGRRRYDVVLENSRTVSLKGPVGKKEAFVCNFRFERKGGYRPDVKKWKAVTGKVWIQRLDEQVPMLPVRVEVETTYGTGYIHMVSAKNRLQDDRTKAVSR